MRQGSGVPAPLSLPGNLRRRHLSTDRSLLESPETEAPPDTSYIKAGFEVPIPGIREGIRMTEARLPVLPVTVFTDYI